MATSPKKAKKVSRMNTPILFVLQIQTQKPQVGDVVLLTQSRVGVIRYAGLVQGRSKTNNDKFYGIEIRMTDGVMGNSDGTFGGVRYFECNTNEGTFARKKDIVRKFKSEVSDGLLFSPSFVRASNEQALPPSNNIPMTLFRA